MKNNSIASDVYWRRFVAVVAVVVAVASHDRQLVAHPEVVDTSDDDETQVDVVIAHPLLGPGMRNAPLTDKAVDRMLHSLLEIPDDLQARKRLELLLEHRLFIADSVCEMSEVQNRKLNLAGRRDIARQLDRVEALRNEMKRTGSNLPAAAQFASLQSQAAELKNAMNFDVFGDNSLFRKVLNHSLTPGQLAILDAFQVIRKAGGEISIRPRAPDLGGVVTEVDLTGTTFNDADATCLRHFPMLESVDLRRTPITDSGLNHLANLKGLKRLVLSRTQITDAGTVALRRLSNLQELDLVDTSVSEIAIAELQRALPGLKIVK